MNRTFTHNGKQVLMNGFYLADAITEGAAREIVEALTVMGDRELLRTIRAANHCLDIQCVDQLGENCVCHAEFMAAKGAEITQ